MLIKNIFVSLSFLLVANLVNYSHAQKLNPEPVEQVLRTLEQQFDVVFTYADENINDLFVVIPKNDLSLDEYIDQLQEQTGLKFTKINHDILPFKKLNRKLLLMGW